VPCGTKVNKKTCSNYTKLFILQISDLIKRKITLLQSDGIMPFSISLPILDNISMLRTSVERERFCVFRVDNRAQGLTTYSLCCSSVLITGMHSTTTFRSMTDRRNDGGPIIL